MATRKTIGQGSLSFAEPEFAEVWHLCGHLAWPRPHWLTITHVELNRYQQSLCMRCEAEAYWKRSFQRRGKARRKARIVMSETVSKETERAAVRSNGTSSPNGQPNGASHSPHPIDSTEDERYGPYVRASYYLRTVVSYRADQLIGQDVLVHGVDFRATAFGHVAICRLQIKGGGVAILTTTAPRVIEKLLLLQAAHNQRPVWPCVVRLVEAGTLFGTPTFDLE